MIPNILTGAWSPTTPPCFHHEVRHAQTMFRPASADRDPVETEVLPESRHQSPAQPFASETFLEESPGCPAGGVMQLATFDATPQGNDHSDNWDFGPTLITCRQSTNHMPLCSGNWAGNPTAAPSTTPTLNAPFDVSPARQSVAGAIRAQPSSPDRVY